MFHRIDDIEAMPAKRFFAFAYRITAYGGLMSSRMEEQVATPAPAAPQASSTPARRIPDATPQAMLSQPHEISELFSFGGV